MTRRITSHKGGRTARAPEARITPAALANIHAEMQERGASWADLIEETYTGGNEMAHANRAAVATKYINPEFQFKSGDVIARCYDMDCQGAIVGSHVDHGQTVYHIHLRDLMYYIEEYDAVLIERPAQG